MLTCLQSAGLNMLEHGRAVQYAFDELQHYIRGGAFPAEWRLPTWLTPEAGSRLLATLPCPEVVRQYQVYHDCGKPQCRTVDEAGRQHFPDHALVSKAVWLAHGGSSEVAELIARDMDVHLLSAEGCAEFAARPQAGALLLTAVAEVLANAPMFGGFESTSFKIKLKHLERRGKTILAAMALNSPT